jgi:hypothetical protein
MNITSMVFWDVMLCGSVDMLNILEELPTLKMEVAGFFEMSVLIIQCHNVGN